MHTNLRSLEQYNEDQFVIKCTFKGEQCEGLLLLLWPGQEMPEHRHAPFEVILAPLKGWAVMRVNNVKEINLLPETVYYEPAGCTFQIKNISDEPFEVLITLVRVETTVSVRHQEELRNSKKRLENEAEFEILRAGISKEEN